MKQKSIGFVLLSNRRAPLASTRISVLQMLPFLEAAGYAVEILFEPETAVEEPVLPADLAERAAQQGIGLVYFQKLHGPSAMAAAAALRRKGIRTVFGVCDLIEDEMARACDATIAISDYLKSLYDPRLQDRIFVVHDGIERPDLYQRSYSSHVGSAREPLKAVLVTAQAPLEIPVLGKLPAFVDLTVISRYPPRLLSAESRAALSGQLASQPALPPSLDLSTGCCGRASGAKAGTALPFTSVSSISI